MVRTRGQEQAEKQGKVTAPSKPQNASGTTQTKKSKGKPEKAATKKSSDTVPQKRSTDEDSKDVVGSGKVDNTPKTKKQKNVSPSPKATASKSKEKVDKLIAEHGAIPLSDLGLKTPDKPIASTVLAHVFNALLSSGRIGHDIAHKTLQCLIDAGYHDLETLKKSTWEERTQVLTDGGYTHYREKTATYLGDLTTLIEEKYDGDAAGFLALPEAKTPKEAHKAIGERVKQIKGLGPLGVEIFLETVQSVCPEVAPFVGKRNVDKAREMGLGSVEGIWEAVGREGERMGRVCVALTKVRLEGR